MKEYLVRLIYCEMLGHATPFGYIHAVKFAQQASLFEKRVGYLAVTLMLHENHELILLLINTIQKDLRSSNIVEICMALTAVARLINAGAECVARGCNLCRHDSSRAGACGGCSHAPARDCAQEGRIGSLPLLPEEPGQCVSSLWLNFFT